MYWRSIHGSSGLHQSDVIASLVRAFKFFHCIFVAALYSNKLILLPYTYWWMKEIYMDPTGFEPAHLETFKFFVICSTNVATLLFWFLENQQNFSGSNKDWKSVKNVPENRPPIQGSFSRLLVITRVSWRIILGSQNDRKSSPLIDE